MTRITSGKVTFAYLKFRGEIDTGAVPIWSICVLFWLLWLFNDFLLSIHQLIRRLFKLAKSNCCLWTPFSNIIHLKTIPEGDALTQPLSQKPRVYPPDCLVCLAKMPLETAPINNRQLQVHPHHFASSGKLNTHISWCKITLLAREQLTLVCVCCLVLCVWRVFDFLKFAMEFFLVCLFGAYFRTYKFHAVCKWVALCVMSSRQFVYLGLPSSHNLPLQWMQT